MSSFPLGNPNILGLDPLSSSLTQTTRRQGPSTSCSPNTFPVPHPPGPYRTLLFSSILRPCSQCPWDASNGCCYTKPVTVLCRPCPAVCRPLRHPTPDPEKGNPWSRTSSMAQKAWPTGPWQLAWHMPDMAHLKAMFYPAGNIYVIRGE